MADDLLYIALEVSLEQTVSFVEDEEIATFEQAIVAFDEVFESAWGADSHLDSSVIDFSVVFLDHCASNEILDVDLGELSYFLSEGLNLES